MSEPLFRPEVFEHRRGSELGTIRLPQSRLSWLLALVAASVLLGLISALAFASHTRKARVQGRLVPAQGLLELAAPTTGTIAALQVRAGQRVAAGQALLQIGAQRSASGLVGSLAGGLASGEVGAAVDSLLWQQRRSLDSDLAAAERDSALQAQALRARADSLQRQIALARQRQAAYREQAAKARALVERMRPLQHDQVISALQIQQYEADAINQESLAQSAEQETLALQEQASDAEHRLLGLPLELARQRSRIEREQQALERSRLDNALESARVLRAPAAGTIAGLRAAPGQSVRGGERLLTLVPDGRALLAELWVPSQAMGGLRVGTPAALRYDAYPYQQHGLQHGEVIELAGAAAPPEEVAARTGLRLDTPAYRALVRLQPSTEPLALRPMMTLQADLLLEREPLYRWLAPRRPPAPLAGAATEPPR